MKKILVIGSLNMDIVLSMEQMPKTGETIIGTSMQYNCGGKGANQAYAAAKLGGAVSMLGCVGRDGFGRKLLDSLSDTGVDTSGILITPDYSTGTATIYVDKNANNSIVVIPGANNACDITYLKENDTAFQECDIVLVQMEIPISTVEYAAERANELGKTVILNPAPAPQDMQGKLLRQVDYITPNETELAALAGGSWCSTEEIKASARTLMEQGAQNIIVTMGKEGVLLVSSDGCKVYPTIKVDAVDTTAAGDCFNAAFVVALSEGMETGKGIHFANVAASLAVTRFGAQRSIPSRSEVDAYLSGENGRVCSFRPPDVADSGSKDTGH